MFLLVINAFLILLHFFLTSVSFPCTFTLSMTKTRHIHKRLLEAIRHMNQRRVILALSLIIGLLSGGAAILLKNLTHFVELRSKSMLLGDHSSDLSFLLPLAGIFVTVVFVKYLLKQDIGHGVSKILRCFHAAKYARFCEINTGEFITIVKYWSCPLIL